MARLNLEPYLKGLRPTPFQDGCIQFQNLIPLHDKAIWTKEYLSDLPTALTDEYTAKGISADWPFPQILHGRYNTYIGTRSGLYTMDRDTYALTAVSPKLASDQTTAGSINSGGVWHMADFGKVCLLTNGASLILDCFPLTDETDLSQDIYVDNNFVPQTLCNHKGRLIMGGLGSATLPPAFEALWDYLRDSRFSGLTDAPTFESGHVWWSSIGGEDMLQWSLPDTVLHSNPINITNANVVNESGFGASTKWTLGSDWQVVAGYLAKGTGSNTTTSQTSANQANAFEAGELYRVEVKVISIVGTLTVGLDDASFDITSTGTHVSYLQPTAAGDITFDMSSNSDTCGVDYIIVTPVDMVPYYELAERGQSGHKWLDDSVYAVYSLGDKLVCYTDSAVWLASPVGSEITPTFGWQQISPIGILDRGAVSVGASSHIFVGSDDNLYRIDNNGVSKIGLKSDAESLSTFSCFSDDRFNVHFLGALDGSDPRTICVSEEGSSLNTFHCYGAFEQDGALYTHRAEDTGTEAPDQFIIETNDIELGPSKKHITAVDVHARDHAATTVHLKTRDDIYGSTYLNIPSATGIILNPQGIVYLNTNARELRVVVKGTAKANTEIKGLSMEVKGLSK
jgi:hypothetical protein